MNARHPCQKIGLDKMPTSFVSSLCKPVSPSPGTTEGLDNITTSADTSQDFQRPALPAWRSAPVSCSAERRGGFSFACTPLSGIPGLPVLARVARPTGAGAVESAPSVLPKAIQDSRKHQARGKRLRHHQIDVADSHPALESCSRRGVTANPIAALPARSLPDNRFHGSGLDHLRGLNIRRAGGQQRRSTRCLPIPVRRWQDIQRGQQSKAVPAIRAKRPCNTVRSAGLGR